MTTKWREYEQVAEHLLNKISDHFNLRCFEGKQKILGDSGTTWEIDAKGCSIEKEIFVIVECKRYPKDRISQEAVAGLAWRIQDTGAEGGIIVSPVGLQEGAKKVANAAEIKEVILNENSTKTDYLLRFLNSFFVGNSEKIKASATFSAVCRDKNGNIIDARTKKF